MDEQQLFTPAWAAEYLKLTVKTLSKYRENRRAALGFSEGPEFTVKNGKPVYTRAALDAWKLSKHGN